jgi:hypothetical protein
VRCSKRRVKEGDGVVKMSKAHWIQVWKCQNEACYFT